MKNASLLDVISIGSQRDCAVVLSSFPHAIHYWPILMQMFRDYHGEPAIAVTKTTIVSRATKTAVRLWVPWSKSREMVMDHEERRRGIELLNLYGVYWGWASDAI